MLKYGKQELSTRVDMPFYTKSGYKLHTKEELKKNPNKQYLGYGYYHSLRYSFHYRDKIYLGLTAEKDAGEPFFAGQNRKGYDFIHRTCSFVIWAESNHWLSVIIV